MLKSAKWYTQQGFSIIATGDNKRAIMPWKEYQERIATIDELTEQFNHPKAKGLAVICGNVSLNLEVIDIDLKNDTTGYLMEQLVDSIPKEIFAKLWQVKTKSGGFHLYYRCSFIEGNQKLASRAANENELKENPHVKQVVLIETRGIGGYVVAPPSDGYTKVNEFQINFITPEERDCMLEVCRSFNEISEQVAIPRNVSDTATTFGKTSWDDYNERGDVVALLQEHGWSFVKQQGERVYLKRPGKTDSVLSADYHTGMNLFKVFSTSTEFEVNKGYKPFAVYTILRHNGNFSEAAKQLFKDGFGEPAKAFEKKILNKVNKSLGAGYSKEKVIDQLMVEEGLQRNVAEQTLADIVEQNGEQILTFWEVNETKQGKEISISRTKFINFLYESGFHLYFYDQASNIFRFVRQNDGFVTEETSESMKKFVKNYIQNLPSKFDSITPNELLEVVLRGGDTYFGKGFLEFLDRSKIDFLKDDPNFGYYPFKNGVVKISQDGAKLLSYGEVNKSVWASDVIDFNIDVDNDFDFETCEFYKFLEKISGTAEKLTYLLSLIGYLLHRYKDPSKPFCAIFAEETEDEKNGGGTGKGILVKALSYMANVERVDGKNFKLDKNFAFQRVGLDTKIVAIEDVRKNVDFEGFYSIITEGITVEKKNKDELFIPYKDSPKILFTTNYTISSVGVHAKRRQKVFEFTNYFSNKHTPMDEFNHKLFDDWDLDEWNRFYNLKFTCIAFYLTNSVVAYDNSFATSRKHVRLNFGEELLDYLDELPNENNNHFRDMYSDFLKRNDYEKKDYSQKRFSKGIEESCERLGWDFEKFKNNQTRLPMVKIVKRV
jgi:hypothetical protein